MLTLPEPTKSECYRNGHGCQNCRFYGHCLGLAGKMMDANNKKRNWTASGWFRCQVSRPTSIIDWLHRNPAVAKTHFRGRDPVE